MPDDPEPAGGRGWVCHGSACMGWRVGEPAKPAYPGDIYRRNDNTQEIFYQAGTARAAVPERGFCGQFGRPA